MDEKRGLFQPFFSFSSELCVFGGGLSASMSISIHDSALPDSQKFNNEYSPKGRKTEQNTPGKLQWALMQAFTRLHESHFANQVPVKPAPLFGV